MSWAELRPSPHLKRELIAVVIALLVSLAFGSVLMLVAGKAPGHVWSQMVLRTFGDEYLLGQVLYKATGLALTGLAVALALDVGLFNIGVEGQLVAGVLASGVVGAALPATTPAVIAIPVCLLAAAGAGALVGLVIGGVRIYRDAHEVITSIMLNASITGLALYIGNVALFRGGSTRGPDIAPGAQLPQLGFGGSSVNAVLVLAVLVVAGMWWLRSRTTWGRAWLAVGADPAAARCAGISIGRVQLLAMAGSGALAGLAATNFVLGHKHAFEEGLGRGTGLLGISAALLGRTHPIGVALATLVLGFLSVGGLAVADEVPKELTEMLQGVVVLAAAGAGPWLARREALQARAA
ncbi:MAG TPA: ABC transporter permease [Kofleriaceae bacterium]|jgi:simple sugar transport system permease protein|nr:ABC transporter permease [Kofleriaceae bacterium]